MSGRRLRVWKWGVDFVSVCGVLGCGCFLHDGAFWCFFLLFFYSVFCLFSLGI